LTPPIFPVHIGISGNITGMRFEWDEAKNERNLLKHNVRFETLWCLMTSLP
jgi:hypothetical protein